MSENTAGLGVAELSPRARVWLGVGGVVLVLGAAVGIKLSGDAFSEAVPWSESTDRAPLDPAALSFTTYELTTAVDGEGTIATSTEGPLYAEGSDVTLTAQPGAGASFAGWAGDIEGDDNPVVVTVDGDVDIRARFVTDVTPPEISALTVTTYENVALLRWATDEPSSSQVAVGTGAAFEIGTFGPTGLSRDHAVTVPGLAPGGTYRYRVSSGNAAGLTAATPDATFTTAGASGPALDVFSGGRTVVGVHGEPQMWANVVGNVSDPDGVSSLSYTLNGGAARPLTVGPDSRRLQFAGDFNADIAVDELQPGDNQVVLTATDAGGATTSSTVVVERRAGDTSLPYETSWVSAGRIDEQGQVVDGRWSLDGGTVRPLELGYDRVLTVGDTSWHDYEVTVPVTVHALGPGNGSHLSGRSLVGLALNWRGHTQVRDEQPGYYYFPTGALGWYRWYDTPRFELRGNDDQPVVRQQRTQMQFDVPYLFKARSETVEGGIQYSWKVWPQGTAEPRLWDLTLVEDAGPETGSVGLIAHHADVRFGDVRVVPIGDR